MKSTPIPRSEGQRLLLALEASQASIAEACEVGAPAVSMWFRGDRQPSGDAQAVLEERFGIERSTWSEAPRFEDDDAEEDDEDFGDDYDPDAGPATAGETPKTVELVDRLIRRVEKTQKGQRLAAKDLVTLVNTQARLLSLRAKIEQQDRIYEDRAVKQSPFWRRLRATIVRSLRRHPKALEDLIADLEEIGAIE